MKSSRMFPAGFPRPGEITPKEPAPRYGTQAVDEAVAEDEALYQRWQRGLVKDKELDPTTLMFFKVRKREYQKLGRQSIAALKAKLPLKTQGELGLVR